MSDSSRGLVLLTGASGFVGGAVMRQLLLVGYEVRALVRRPREFSPPPKVVTCPGDITDLDSVVVAARGCDSVIHCAADYRLSLRARDVNSMIAVNVGGTATVLRAAHQAGVRRVVHCSTVGTLAFERSGRICSETNSAPSPALLAGPYKRTKWAAERLALDHAPDALEVVVVQPSTPVGLGDHRPTPTGQTIRDFLAGKIPAVVETGLNLVAVDAVANGHLLALERGVAGRTYILGDRNLTLRQLLGQVAEIAGVAPPRWRVPLGIAFAAAIASEARGRVERRAPGISLTSVRMAAHPMYVDSQRAQSELGWRPGDLSLALRQSIGELIPASRTPVG
ncbi:MAG: NAD-dependent epimerase/dehydratase family protein [Candidatus Dormiibacterota bacterium]